jgi:hypothetical protein
MLRRLCPPGTTVYTDVAHVSRSGMMRHIRAFVIQDKEPFPISAHVARVLGWPLNDGRSYWAVKVGGCGMDMGFHLVNALSYKLHGMKDRGDGAKSENSGRLFTPRRGHFCAGYSLSQRWL